MAPKLTLRSPFRRFLADERGAFAVMFGVMAIVLVAFGGAVVDFVELERTRSQAQVALDAAALALQPSVYADPLPDEKTLRQQAEALVRRQVSGSATVDVLSATLDLARGSITLTAQAEVPTIFVALLGVHQLGAAINSEAARGNTDIEIAVALDVTGSMAGQRVADLKVAANELVDIIMADVEPGSRSRIALVPYSVGVNLGAQAVQARGPIEPAHPMSAAYWASRAGVPITGATKAQPVVVTAPAHGLTNGSSVYISGVAGMTQLNGKAFTVTSVSTNRFTLQGVDGRSYGTYSSGGTVRPCAASGCEVVVTASGHNFTTGQNVYLKDVGGMSQISNRLYQLTSVTGASFALSGTFGPNYSNYTSGGEAYCVLSGCRYYYFRNMQGNMRFFEVSTCVSERTAMPFTDAAPSTAYLGRNYAASGNPCSLQSVTPLTDDGGLLETRINALAAGGSTGGHLGVAWTWYMLSPNFGDIWPSADNRPGSYGDPQVAKMAIIMTDGEYNSVYCDGVISQDSTSGSGNASDHINCNAPNGNPYYQANQYCASMKAAGITVYTVGFQIIDSAAARNFMSSCATSSEHAYLAENGAALRQAFIDIAESIQTLRLTL